VAGTTIMTVLSEMVFTLSLTSSELIGDNPGTLYVEPEVGMNIEKVGRTSAYTSATILNTGVTVVDIETPIGPITYSDQSLAMFFSLPGDSGSVACEGGAGNLKFAEFFLALLAECDLLGAVGSYYDIPLNTSENNTLADDVRDNFLAQSMTGQLLIQAGYANQQVVIDRLSSADEPSNNKSWQQAEAQRIWSLHYASMAKLAASKSPTAVFSKSDLQALYSVQGALLSCHMITDSEYQQIFSLFTSVFSPAVGKNRTQLIDYMNEESVYKKVYNKITGSKTLTFPGPVSAVESESG
jgi:hypothetical protein